MRSSKFQQYTTDYISGVMSLRRPQIESLKILENILKEVEPKSLGISNALEKINNMYPKCTDFERDFISLTFALATGVGKTRLMGTFITYLYTNYNIKNFLVIAPNTTIYEKLKKDFGDSSNPKYVFKGIGCFSNPPQVIADDDYRERNISFFESEVKIYIFNISKLDKENAKIRAFNEILGQSFFEKLSELKDLVMIMDESHHYRAERGMQTLNELKPLLGLELTATPFVNTKSKQQPFKNVVYEYPLAKAIADGYTRTPYAVTRSNINFFNFGDEQIDRLMLEDGILCHENIKSKLIQYSQNNNKPLVKPFVLVVCKDTEHANLVFNMIQSDSFHDGIYKNKVIIVHSENKSAEMELYLKQLLEIEKNTNPIEIVIHVNMLKEGWDVNNLYTIVPLRTASSRILREQMIGRGLRLPYGERTGEKEIDSVYLTAHDKFDEILEEAKKGESIFKKEYMIEVEELVKEETRFTQLTFDTKDVDNIKDLYLDSDIEKNQETDKMIRKAKFGILDGIVGELYNVSDDINESELSQKIKADIVNQVKESLEQDEDLAKIYKKNEMPLTFWMLEQVEKVHREVVDKFIPIPQIKITEEGICNYIFEDFDLDFSKFIYAPIENELLIQSLTDDLERECIKGSCINYEAYNPQKVLLEHLKEKPEIDYSKCSQLLQKLIFQVCTYYLAKYDENRMKNIIMMNKKSIANDIYVQMLQHFKCENGFLKEEVISSRKYNLRYSYSGQKIKNIFEGYDSKVDGNIKSIVFDGIKRGVFDIAKFDSVPELKLARILERERDYVKNWLRPAPTEFNISYEYNGKHRYEPDFVVETQDVIYLVEVKRSDMTEMEEVIAKKDRAISYCKIVSEWSKANGYKEWEHIFIPDDAISEYCTFEQLSKRFVVE